MTEKKISSTKTKDKKQSQTKTKSKASRSTTSEDKNIQNKIAKLVEKIPKKAKIIAAATGILVVIIAFIVIRSKISYSIEQSKVYSISVEGAVDEQCSNDPQFNMCSGSITLPANIGSIENGKLGTKEISLSGTEGGTIQGGSIYPSDDGKYILPAFFIINEEEYTSLIEAGKYEKGLDNIRLLDKDGKERARYTLMITCTLSDEDKAKLADLEQKRQARIAEEARQKAEAEAEEARQKAEAERKKAEAQAAAEAAKAAEEARKAEENIQNTKKIVAHTVCKDYIEAYFFPYETKVHSIIGVASDQAYGESWYYSVDVTVKSSAGGKMDYRVNCFVGEWKNLEGGTYKADGSVISFKATPQ